MKTRNPYIPAYFLVCGIILAIGTYLIVAVNAYTNVKQARFNVDVLQRFLIAHKKLHNVHIQNLNDLPDFHIISTGHSLSVKDDDFKQGVKGGYVYDYQIFRNGQFVISASSVGIINASREIGITEKGELRFNDKNVDVDADSYGEVESWKPVQRFKRYRTKGLPEYMK